MADCIPYADGDFEAWQDNSITYAGASAAAQGLDPLVDIPPLTVAQTAWTNDRAAHTAVQAVAETARQAKDAARGELDGVLPDMGRWKLRNNQFDDICARVGTRPARSKRMASLFLQEVRDGYCQTRQPITGWAAYVCRFVDRFGLPELGRCCSDGWRAERVLPRGRRHVHRL